MTEGCGYLFLFLGCWTSGVPVNFLVAAVDGWKCVCVPQCANCSVTCMWESGVWCTTDTRM